jgi:hypothetical protein
MQLDASFSWLALALTPGLASRLSLAPAGVPGNATQPFSFAPNQGIKQGAKLVTCAEDVFEELCTPVRAALVQAERPEAGRRQLLCDDIVERSGLNSSDVPATLVQSGNERNHPAIARKTVQQSVAVEAHRGRHRRSPGRHQMLETHPQGPSPHQ